MFSTGTHSTPKEISLHLGNVSESSVRRIVRDDLKRLVLTDDNIEKRESRCRNLIKIFSPSEALETVFFSDEKIFKVQQLYNQQNDRLYVPKGTDKSSIDPSRLFVERTGFPKYLKVSVGVSKLGKTKLHFFDSKVTGEYYRILREMIPEMDSLAGGRQYIFMQDGAPAHTAKKTIEMLEAQDQLQPLLPECWPANSPDLNPVDYCIWSELERRVFRGRIITSTEDLKKALKQEWKKFPQETINNAIDAFPKRLARVVQEKGGHIEHY